MPEHFVKEKRSPGCIIKCGSIAASASQPSAFYFGGSVLHNIWATVAGGWRAFATEIGSFRGCLSGSSWEPGGQGESSRQVCAGRGRSSPTPHRRVGAVSRQLDCITGPSTPRERER
ncbi:hypothetical protein D623_10020899 [Myotis brandtii]|uniref:Uncharacterized protein n=1 Tax=Myotis brandtii TaxID=109478 RepID=S7MY35_MYOBR|nr:hypothetical protein D623_10020899 [Myotis brandtii]